jgi:5S rRNA maturation endonuclease (ribonuclease M5)
MRTAAVNKTRRIDADALKRQAAGRWPEILSALGGASRDALDSKNHPCPKCGGNDRFRFTNLDGNGSCYCNQCGKGIGDGIAALTWLRGWDFNTAVAELAKYLGIVPPASGNGKRKIVATYDYTDEQGKLLYQAVRYDPKDFQQRRPKAGGSWEWKVKGCRLVLYHLPLLLAAAMTRTVAILEGEKDVESAERIGLVATCNVGGAGKWRPEYNEHFRGRPVVIFADADKPGRQHANQVALSLHGIASAIKVIELSAKDLSDWLAQGHTQSELVEIIKAAPRWKPAPGDKQPEPPPYVPFLTDTLPKVVADFTHEGAAALGCDESYIALPLLTMLASAVGNSRCIRLKRTWCEPAMIWAVVVGESGTLKSPAHDLATKPLHRLQNTALKQYGDQVEDYNRDKALYDADLAEWKKSGRKKGEPPPEPPAEPVAVRYLVSDCTVEALAVLLEQRPRGLLVARDELSGWVNSFDAYKSCRGADVAHWLSMHRAGPLTVDRKSGRRTIHVPRASVCISGGVQPKALVAALVGRYQAGGVDEAMDKPDKEHFDNGLAARLLFAMPPRRPKRWTEDELPWQTETALETLVGRLLALDMPEDENGQPQPRDIPLSPLGKQAWVDFYNAHACEQAEMSGDLAAAWSKLEGYAARFALLVHLIRAESGDTTLPDAGAVDEQSIAAGVALSRWFGDEAARVYAEIGGDAESPEAREQRELVRIIRDRGGEITVRGLMQASRRYRGSAEEAEAALGRLATADLVDVWDDKHGSQGGRPVVVFTLRDSGNGNTTSEIPEESGVVLPLPPPKEPESEMMEWTG